MADVTMSLEEYYALMNSLSASGQRLNFESTSVDTNIVPITPKKRKVSRYNREFGRQLKRLKAKHPKTQSKNLMKRAHALTKKALKS